jgi:hypothetical protein
VSDTYELTLEVVPLPNGRFAVRQIGRDLVDGGAGEFASRAEAEAWILDHAMIEDEETFDTGVIKPGDGQGVA